MSQRYESIYEASVGVSNTGVTYELPVEDYARFITVVLNHDGDATGNEHSTLRIGVAVDGITVAQQVCRSEKKRFPSAASAQLFVYPRARVKVRLDHQGEDGVQDANARVFARR